MPVIKPSISQIGRRDYIGELNQIPEGAVFTLGDTSGLEGYSGYFTKQGKQLVEYRGQVDPQNVYQTTLPSQDVIRSGFSINRKPYTQADLDAPGVPRSLGTSGGSSISQQDYQFRPGESVEAYNTRIANLRGETSSGGSSGLTGELDAYIQKLQAAGYMINPNVQLTPEKMAEFMSQAGSEINPYYSGQLKLAKDTLLRGIGYGEEDILRHEQQVQQQYGRQLQSIGEQAAEQGFAQSGLRQLSERQLAEQTQQDIDAQRRGLTRGATEVAAGFAQQYGTRNLPALSFSGAPRVLPGVEQFQTDTQESPVYSLSSDIYQGLTGEKQYQQEADIRRRASELESAYRTGQTLPSLRTLV